MLYRLLSPSMELRLFKLTSYFWSKAAKTKTKQEKREVPTHMASPPFPLGDNGFYSPSRVRVQLTHLSGSAALLEHSPYHSSKLSKRFSMLQLPVGHLGDALQVKGKATQLKATLPLKPKFSPRAKHGTYMVPQSFLHLRVTSLLSQGTF